MSKHTETPWAVENSQLCEGHFITADKLGWRIGIADLCPPIDSPSTFGLENRGDFIALNRNETKANAAYIVKVCNAFPDLVEALERIQDMFVVPESGFLLEKYQDLRAIGAEMSRVAEKALHSLKSEG